jgi:peptidoglycan LD-endopeptidase CwlK
MITQGEDKLKGLHPDLVRVIRRAARTADFAIVEGVRTLARQRQLVASGASRTLNSRHIPARNGLAHAIDIYPVVDDNLVMDWSGGHFARLARLVKATAKAERVPLEWGGDWKRFRDGPHWQLPWAAYPGDGADKAVADHPRMVKAGLEGVNAKPLMQSRTVAGSSLAAMGGVGLVINDARTALEQVQGQISTGTAIGMVIGGLVVAGALWALYARWDDAGRPLPWRS